MRSVFVAGSHTDVGKTYVACALIRAARARGLSVDALKPVASGFDEADWAASDSGLLLAVLGRPATPQALQAVSPWRFRAALAPPMAARAEGRGLNLEEIVRFCRARIAAAQSDLLVIEGVGGLMSPITDKAVGLDLMATLGAPAVLVGGSYLGAVSHILTGVEAMRARRLELKAVVVSETADPGAPDFAETAGLVAGFAGVRVAAARRGVDDWADAVLGALV